ncbi:hypothetical protein VB264_12675 [Arcicella aquatica]|uniref:Uracil-DNA glycosylase-like domain-containing protein n=1 Tax=Arcicella aquatica TaxID=217141 RepID=A0ABU5QNK1_9BACT|nr:hypothetical protein [Arcicella aquatica]MEA5258643.1 hypothetical protein [Arcicella aquatica]
MNLNIEENYPQAIQKWKEEIADTYDSFAKNKDFDLDLDFYVFQSSVQFAPPLLMIGANPGEGKSYSEFNKSNNRDRRTANDLGYDSNQFLANQQWHSRSLCNLFSGEKLLPMFENAVITNVAYFNTSNFVELKRRKSAREAINFSRKCNKELINILQPKNIILLGKVPLDELRIFFDEPEIPILKTRDEKTILIRQTSINGIPTFCIHHPSRNTEFNTGENLEIKKKKLEQIL